MEEGLFSVPYAGQYPVNINGIDNNVIGEVNHMKDAVGYFNGVSLYRTHEVVHETF